MDEIKQEMNEIRKSLHSVDITLAKQQVSLDEHIRRTNLLEEYVKEDKEQFQIITKHITQVKFAAVLFVFILGTAATWYGHLK